MLLAKYSACTYVLQYVASSPASPPITCPLIRAEAASSINRQLAPLLHLLFIYLSPPKRFQKTFTSCRRRPGKQMSHLNWIVSVSFSKKTRRTTSVFASGSRWRTKHRFRGTAVGFLGTAYGALQLTQIPRITFPQWVRRACQVERGSSREVE